MKTSRRFIGRPVAAVAAFAALTTSLATFGMTMASADGPQPTPTESSTLTSGATDGGTVDQTSVTPSPSINPSEPEKPENPQATDAGGAQAPGAPWDYTVGLQPIEVEHGGQTALYTEETKSVEVGDVVTYRVTLTPEKVARVGFNALISGGVVTDVGSGLTKNSGHQVTSLLMFGRFKPWSSTFKVRADGTGPLNVGAGALSNNGRCADSGCASSIPVMYYTDERGFMVSETVDLPEDPAHPGTKKTAVQVGDTVTYHITVEPKGSEAVKAGFATDVSSIQKYADIVITENDNNLAKLEGGKITWGTEIKHYGHDITFTATIRPTPTGGAMENTVSPSLGGTCVPGNTCSSEVKVLGDPPRFTVEKTLADADQKHQVGDVLTYTLRVKSLDSEHVVHASLSDDLKDTIKSTDDLIEIDWPDGRRDRSTDHGVIRWEGELPVIPGGTASEVEITYGVIAQAGHLTNTVVPGADGSCNTEVGCTTQVDVKAPEPSPSPGPKPGPNPAPTVSPEPTADAGSHGGASGAQGVDGGAKAGANGSNASSDAGLADTGSESFPLLLLGMLVLAVGAVTVVSARRRQTA